MKRSDVYLLAATTMAANTLNHEWRLILLLLIVALGILVTWVERND
jgi:hypothetical protein